MMADVPETFTLDEPRMEALRQLAGKRETLDPERRALVEEMAKKYQIPLAPAQGFSQLPNPRKEALSEMGQSAKVAALPMAGQLAGAVAGQVMAPGNVPVNLALQSGGAMLGTKANEMLGVSKPDELDYALSGGAPLLGFGVVKAARKLTPGGAAAEQAIGAEALAKTPALLEGSKHATDTAYTTARQFSSTPIPVNHFSDAITKLGSVESTAKSYGVGNAQIQRTVKGSAEQVSQGLGNIPLGDVNTLLKRFREKAAGLEQKGGEQFGAYKSLRQALFKDMDAAAVQGGAGVTELRAAMTAAKKSIAKEEYTDILTRYGTRMETIGGQTFEVIEPTKVLNKLRAIGFADSVGAKEYAKIESTLKDLAKIPKPDLAMQSGLGSEGRALTMTGAGIAGTVAGGPLGGVGTALATAATMKAHDAVAKLFMSDPGRKFLVKLFRHNQGRLGERTSEVLQFAADQFQEAPQE